MADILHTVTIGNSNSLTRDTALTGEVVTSALLSSAQRTALDATVLASTAETLSAGAIVGINLIAALDADSPTEWDATNIESVNDFLQAITDDVVAADVKAGISDLTTMVASEDASFTTTLHTVFKNLMSEIESDGLAANDITILNEMLGMLAAGDASWTAQAKDLVKRLIALAKADETLTTVESAIAALE